MNVQKICKKCKIPKDFDGFYRKHDCTDGREGVCKDCRERARRNRATHESKVSIAKAKKQKVLEEHKIQIKNVDLLEQVKKHHGDTFFQIAFYPQLDGWVIQIKEPRFHKEGKCPKALLEAALSLPAVNHSKLGF